MAVLAVVGTVVMVVVLGGFIPTLNPSGNPPPPGSNPIVVMNVAWGSTSGTIRIELDPVNAPATAGNFQDLVESGFYNNRWFCRVAANFVIQGGNSSGPGCQGGSSTLVPWEDTGLKNTRYTIAMARSQPNDASSQFFINLNDNTNLDQPPYPYVVFGKVIQGTSIVDAIGQLYPAGDPTYDGEPTQPVKITSARMV